MNIKVLENESTFKIFNIFLVQNLFGNEILHENRIFYLF